MKIKCNREDIKKGFNIVESVVSSSTIKPTLQNVKVVASGNTLELSTTDLEISIKHIIESVDVIEAGTIVCHESRISSIVKEWTSEEVEISEENRICKIAGSKEFFKVLCADPEDFPAMPEFEEEDYIEMDSSFLAEMIRRTSFIILAERLKYGSKGVFLDVDEKVLKMVANDGRRLSEVKKKINNQAGVKRRCIIPIKGISQILRILQEQGDIIKVKLNEKRILVKNGNTVLCSQLIEGQYPEYEDVIPKDLDKKVILNKDIFASAIRRCAIMTTEEYKLLKFKISNDLLEVECNSPDVGESKVEIPVEYSGEEIEIGLNPDYILDFMKVIDTEKVELMLKDRDTAAVFKVGNNCTYVVMPMDLER